MASATSAECPTDPYAPRERHHNEGQGRRLTAAFEALEAFPVLAETRNRVLRLFEEGEPASADLIRAVEGDVALAIAVMRLGKKGGWARRAAGSRPPSQAVDVLSPRNGPGDCRRARTYDFFERTAVWQGIPERFRLHGIATQRAADRIAARDRLRGARPPDGHLAAARHRQARARPRLSGLSAAGPRRRADPGGARAARAPRARGRPRAGRRRDRPALGPAGVDRAA